MDADLIFVLPDGRNAIVPARQARELAESLWSLGIEPGAAPAATRITAFLNKRRSSRSPLEFEQREAGPLLRVGDGTIAWAPASSPAAG